MENPTVRIPTTSVVESSKAIVDVRAMTSYNSSQPLPPDLVSASSCSAVDDNISDISEADERDLLSRQRDELEEDEQYEDEEQDAMTPKSPRSIFSGFWSKSGTEPIPLKVSKELKRTVTLPADWKLEGQEHEQEEDDDTAKLYERSILHSEDKLVQHSSLPTLRPRSSVSGLMRSSTSDLLPAKLSSCFKGTASPTSKRNHVKFATNVSILEYKEVSDWPSTNEGWSKYFH